MPIMRQLLFCILLLMTQANPASAGPGWSYVYIQGDKELPFYVKLEGQMLPRYGKNYCIIPQLAAGEVQIQILFQQNQAPPQQYTILVPEDGFRGFLLTKKDNSYSLYDLQQHFYLLPGMADRIPVMPVTAADTRPAPPVTPSVPEEAGAAQGAGTTLKTNTGTSGSKSREPRFMEHVVLNDKGAPESGAALPVHRPANARKTDSGSVAASMDREQNEEIDLESDTAPILNSDCPEPMPADAYARIYQAASESGRGDKLIGYLLKKIPDNCYSTRQVYQLADLMDEEAVIYLYLKRVFPRVTDQHNFHLLETHLFESEEWIRAFRLIH